MVFVRTRTPSKPVRALSRSSTAKDAKGSELLPPKTALSMAFKSFARTAATWSRFGARSP